MSDFERGDRVYLLGSHSSVKVMCDDETCEKNHVRTRDLETGEFHSRRHYDPIKGEVLATVIGYEGERVVIALDNGGYEPNTGHGAITTEESALRRV